MPNAGGRRNIARIRLLGAVVLAVAWLGANMASAELPRVVVTIKPVHAIVAGVMRGIGDPALLLPDGASPHAYAMRPSDARLLRRADLIVWVGEELESFMQRPLKTLSRKASILELLRQPGIRRLGVRGGAAWEVGAHGNGHEDADRRGKRDRAHGHSGRARGEVDPHIWLDPVNGKTIATLTAARLAALDRPNAPRYRENAARVVDALTRLEHDLRAALTPVRAIPYIVFHDSYQYFERRFALNAVGAMTLSPERKPGARRLSRIRRKIVETGARCVFSEPQFQSSLVETVIRGTAARTAVLDPLGTTVAVSPGAYAATLRNLAAALARCLSSTS